MPASFIQITGSPFYTPDDVRTGITRTDPAGLTELFDALVFPKHGDVTEAASVAIQSDTRQGYIQMSYLQDFYNRIHFTPQQIDFGVISGDTQRSILVWNAYLVSTDLDVITPPAAANVDVFAGPALSHTFGPLATATYTFVAYQAGPSSFYSETVFEFDNGDIHPIITSGDRSVITEIGPNWSVGVTERFEYLTEIVSVSRDGHEQRRALRATPRRSVSYNVNIWDDDRLKTDGILTKWRRRTQLVALSPYRCVLSVDTATGALVLPVDGVVPSWVQPGVYLKFAGRGVPEGMTAVVDSTTPGTITLTSVTTQDLPAGALILWTMTGRLRDGTKVNRLTDRKQSVEFAFDGVPGVDPVYTPAAAALTFRGRELFLKKPNWSSAVEVEYQHPLEIVDFRRGIQTFYEPINFAAYTMKLSFSGRRESEILELTDFFRRQYGTLYEFYYPTWGPDIAPKFQLDLDAVNIRVEGFDLALAYQSQTTHQALLVQLRDGTMIPAAVEDVYTVSDGSGDDSVIQVVDAWGANYPVSSILKISWLMRCRLGSDTMEVRWLTDNAATTQLTFLSLEHLT